MRRRTVLGSAFAAALAGTAAVARPAAAQEATPATDGSAAVVRRLYEEVFNQGNPDVVDELYAPDFVDHTPGAPQGPAGAKQVIGGVLAGLPDLRVTAEPWLVDGDLVATLVTFRGTHQGELLGVAPTGQPVEWSHIDIHRVEGGRITELWHPGLVPAIQLALGFQLAPPTGTPVAGTPTA